MIQRKFLQRIFAILAIPVLASCASGKKMNAEKEQNSLFWKVTGNGLAEPSYILGTIHLACKDDINLGPGIAKAVADSKEVFFEMDLDDPSLSLSMLGMMTMGKGKTLKDLYSPEDYDRLKNFCKDSLALDISKMNNYKPFFLVSSMFNKLMPCKKVSGVDREVLMLAKENKKTISGLESVQFQASIFDSIPYEVQAKELLAMTDSFNTYRSYMAKLSEDYRNRNLTSLAEMMMKTDLDFGGAGEMLIYRRNSDWAGQLKEIMKNKNVFVAVGAGHLPGDRGLIRLLRKEGFKLVPAGE